MALTLARLPPEAWRGRTRLAYTTRLSISHTVLCRTGIGTAAHEWLGLGGGECTGEQLRVAMASGALLRVAFEEPRGRDGSVLAETAAALSAGARAPSGSFGAAVLAEPAADAVFILRGCPRLGAVGWELGERVEGVLRRNYQRAAALRRAAAAPARGDSRIREAVPPPLAPPPRRCRRPSLATPQMDGLLLVS